MKELPVFGESANHSRSYPRDASFETSGNAEAVI
jgi:hypothetical protein